MARWLSNEVAVEVKVDATTYVGVDVDVIRYTLRVVRHMITVYLTRYTLCSYVFAYFIRLRIRIRTRVRTRLCIRIRITYTYTHTHTNTHTHAHTHMHSRCI